jgi:hypothetical protein
MKAIVFFYDGKDITTGVFISMEEALKEDYIQVKGNEFVPFDECSIIFWYTDNGGPRIYSPNSQAMLANIGNIRNVSYGTFKEIAATAEF